MHVCSTSVHRLIHDWFTISNASCLLNIGDIINMCLIVLYCHIVLLCFTNLFQGWLSGIWTFSQSDIEICTEFKIILLPVIEHLNIPNATPKKHVHIDWKIVMVCYPEQGVVMMLINLKPNHPNNTLNLNFSQNLNLVRCLSSFWLRYNQ